VATIGPAGLLLGLIGLLLAGLKGIHLLERKKRKEGKKRKELILKKDHDSFFNFFIYPVQMPNRCPKCAIQGSGYVKPETKDPKLDTDLKKLLDQRAQQDTKYFPK
jgi:hypothetical protein